MANKSDNRLDSTTLSRAHPLRHGRMHPASSAAQSPAPDASVSHGNNTLFPPNLAPSFFGGTGRPNYALLTTPGSGTPASGTGTLGQYAVSHNDMRRLDQMFKECQRVNQAAANEDKSADTRSNVFAERVILDGTATTALVKEVCLGNTAPRSVSSTLSKAILISLPYDTMFYLGSIFRLFCISMG